MTGFFMDINDMHSVNFKSILIIIHEMTQVYYLLHLLHLTTVPPSYYFTSASAAVIRVFFGWMTIIQALLF